MMGNYIKNISSKTSLTVKSLLITLIVGIAIWTILDYFQTAKLREIFHQELVRELGVEAADRDVEIERYIAVHFQSAEIISSNVGMRNYVETVSWSEGEDITYKEYLEKPEWLAGASVVKDFLNIRSALLLDRHYRVREIFHEDTAVLPPEILSPMAALVEASQLKSHIVEAGGIPYIIASRKVPGLLNAPEAILMIVAPLDNDFLLDALRGYRSDVIVALINSEKIISSSNARVLPMNTDIGRIEEKYLVFKDEVLSQRVARFDMFFVNIVSKAKYELMIGSVLNVERLNRAITAAALLLVFSGIIFFITRKVRKVSTMMGAFVSETLNTNQSALDSGDELYIMERQFDFLKRQILSYNKAMFKTAATLSYERDRTQNYFDVAGVMIIAVNTDYEVTRINRMGCEIMGCDKSMIIGKNWLDEYVTASDRRRVREIFTGLISGSYDGIQTGEFLVNRCDGQERVMLWNMSVLREGKNVTGVLSSCEDITDRKAVEHKLHKSNIELAVKNDELKTLFKELDATNKERQKIMDCVGDLIILADNAGKIQRVNEPVCSFAGKLNEDILGMDWEILLSELGLIAQTFYAGSIELYHQGSGRWFSMTSYVIEDTELALAGNVITLHETTEIKAITEELEHTSAEIEASREAIKTALEQISNLIQNVTMNTDYEIVIHNDYMAKCYEMKNCGKINCPCYGIEPERCWQVAGTYCGGQVQGEFAQKYGNCSECIVYKKATSNPILEIGEQFNNMMHVLKTKNELLKDAYENIKNTQSQMLQGEKMASIGQLAAGVAHEINNPMGFISSNLRTLDKYMIKLLEYMNASNDFVEAVKDSDSSEMKALKKKLNIEYILDDVADLIKESLEGADRVKVIVQNLKSFSRIDQAEHKLADINECIESTLNIVWNELKYKAEVARDFGEIPEVSCYPQQLNQVFMNILVNAAQAIEKQGSIGIKTWSNDGHVYIAISDTGQGIPEDKVQKIFDPFFTTKPVGKGTGLGLSIVYDIIQKHDGKIDIESVQGQGSTFTIELPVGKQL